MNFAAPSALLWALLALPVVLFYVLKIRLRRMPVSTTLFWEQVFEENKPRALWRRLRHLLSLLVQLAFLVLLVLALTDPFFRWEVLEARRVVVILDNSASMNAREDDGTRFEEARAAAEASINRLRFRDTMALISAGTEPRVECGLTSHARTLREALAAVRPTEGPTRVMDAVELARRLLGSSERAEILVFTDAGFAEAGDLASAPGVSVTRIGGERGNLAITRFQARRSLVDPVGYEVLAEVANFSPQAARCRFELELEGGIVDVVPLDLQPGERWIHSFEKTSSEGGQLTALLTGEGAEDALRVDNESRAVLPARRPLRVVLVGPDNLFVNSVLVANPLVRLQRAEDVVSAPAERDVLVLLRTVPETMPDGDVLVIEPTGSCDLWELGEVLDNPLVVDWDRESPLMLHVQLANAIIPEARQLRPRPGAGREFHALATALTEDPLYLEIRRESGRVLVLTAGLERGDLPLRTAFPIMITQALAAFAGTRGELREALAAGAVAEVVLPALDRVGAAGPNSQAIESDEEPLILRAPDGTETPLRARRGRALIGPLRQTGLWVVRRRGAAGPEVPGTSVSATGGVPPQSAAEWAEREPDAVVLSCNLSDPGESDLAIPDERAAQLAAAPGPSQAGLVTRPLWFYLAVLAFLLVTAEWGLYQRRRLE